MLQATMVNQGRIEFEEVSKPTLKREEVLLKVKRIGICGSDIHVFHGKHPYTSYPIIQGHEISGEVVEVGQGIDNIREGQIVTLRPQVVCGKCYPCTHDDYHICDNLKVMGFQTDGAAREYFAVSSKNLIPTPEEISFDEAAMVELTAVTVHALKRDGDVKGKNVLVLGAGPIGNLVAQVATAMEARSVMITDISDFRLKVALECGIEHCVNVTSSDLGEEILSKFGRDKMDITIECVGLQETIEQAVRLARKGSTIIVVGVFGGKSVIDMGLVQDRELKLIGALM